MTKCCGFCLERSNITGKCRRTKKEVKYNDCCDNFIPLDWEYKK